MTNLDKIRSAVAAKITGGIGGLGGIKGSMRGIPFVESNAHAPRNFMVPLQIERIKTDLESWRLAVIEMENANYPHRFREQQLLIDVVLEGHVAACLKKRKQMTLLKQFKIGKQNDEGVWVENKVASAIFKKKWFKELVGYGLDAQFYGYSLIQLGDLISKGGKYDFKNLTILKRWHVSPDRKQLVQVPYQTWGIDIQPSAELRMFQNHDDQYATHFTEDVDANGVPFDDWMVYVDTPSDNGSSICGYGLLYTVALYAIILKNNLGFNAKFNEMFVAPYRVIKTQEKFDTQEYAALKRSAQQMGSFGYLLLGTNDEIQFANANTGTGYQSYADIEKRCQAMISKLIGGHANFLDSQATALGGGNSGKSAIDQDSTPEGQAIAAMEKEQNDFALSFLNDICYPKFQNIGIPLKDDECFYLPNDKEDFELRIKNDSANLGTATVWKTAKEAGLKLDAKTFENITGIPTEAIEDPVVQPNAIPDKGLRMAAKLNKTYNHGGNR